MTARAIRKCTEQSEKNIKNNRKLLAVQSEYNTEQLETTASAITVQLVEQTWATAQ